MSQILKDGTFKSASRTLYPDINSRIPIFLLPMSDKSEYLYYCIFNDVKNIIKDYGYDITNIIKNFMIDFEKPLQTTKKFSCSNY